MAAGAQAPSAFEPAAYQSFRFLDRRLEADGTVTLRYGLGDGGPEFVERVLLPVARPLDPAQIDQAQALLALLHWVAGVSYYKAALAPRVSFEGSAPGPAAAALLAALYSEGLGELAYRNRLASLPRPDFPGAAADPIPAPASAAERERVPARVLVPVGGGKDSALAIEVVRGVAAETVLFSIGEPPPIARTVAVAGLAHLLAQRTIDPLLLELNAAGAINGHVPITAIVSCIAVLTAALNGLEAVAMANERSASSGNLEWDGVEVNHQFSKGLRAERLLSAALRELRPDTPRCFSVLRPASELAIARGFSKLERYHRAFTSCNAMFRIDPSQRARTWCCDCPKCRFVFLALAPFSTPEHLSGLFGRDLLADEAQYEGFALLAASGGHKPFECVGEEQESIAAIRLLAADERWREHPVLARLAREVLPAVPPGMGDPQKVLALSEDHDVPDALLAQLDALLRA